MSQQQHQVAPHAATELAIKPSINTLAQGSMFWQPDYREPSSWLEHLPFLFWLVEALRPQQVVGLGVDDVAHFAVCQAASRLRLGTRCYMVGEDVDEKAANEIHAYASDHFSAISQWLQTNPTRAIEQFDEGSIDLLLLHISPDDNSVDYLLDRWLSRLSSQGVVVVPGIARREPGCFVFRAFESIKNRYPHFVFHHAGGLGVIAVGNELPHLVNNLLGALESNASTQVVQDVFARLGRSCQDKVTVRQQQALFQTLETRVSEQAGSLAEAERQVAQQAEQLRQAHDERIKLKERLEQQEARFAQERGRLAERVSSLEEFNAELKNELMRQREQGERHAAEAREHAQAAKVSEQTLNQAQKQLEEKNNALETARTEHTQLTGKLEKTEHALTEAQAQVESLKSSEQALNNEVNETKQIVETRFSELAKLTNLLEANEQSLQSAREERAELDTKLQQAESSLEARFNELGQLTRKLQEAEQRIIEGEKNRAEAEKQLAQQKKASEDALSAQLKDALHSVDERFKELAVLTDLLEKNEAQRKQLERELESTKVARQKLEADAKISKQKLEAEAKSSKQKLEAEAKSSKQKLENRAEAEKQMAQQKKASEDALSAQLKDALHSVDERFKELAVLTDLLEKNEAQRKQLERELESTKVARQELEADAKISKQKLEAEAKSSREAQAQQRREIERQTHELAHLVEQLEALRMSQVAKSPAAEGTGVSVAKAPALTKRAIKRQVSLIEASQWFDAKWYLAQYPDIASDPKMSASPARHYLLMGGFEGRNPSPEFDSAYYLTHNPDVVESGINPLVHYLKFGEKEQRSVKG
ncbi:MULTISPECIES: hypothetical protein [unclassified Halomonas]|uniref:hypothetical protein n=1 Tax=unclassified Halomonas TaxID=2609666 RepID=UPI0040331924